MTSIHKIFVTFWLYSWSAAASFDWKNSTANLRLNKHWLSIAPRNETEYQVPVVEPTPDRVLEIQEELGKLLFGDSG